LGVEGPNLQRPTTPSSTELGSLDNRSNHEKKTDITKNR
jgi:hypothetical protein